MPAKGQGKKQKGDRFGKLYGGARGAGYDSDEAAAMAYKKVYGVKESLERFHRNIAKRHKR